MRRSWFYIVLLIVFVNAFTTLGHIRKIHCKYQAATSDTIHLLLPEFYDYKQEYKKDTLIEYRCYNDADSLIARKELGNFESVKYVTCIKTYLDPNQTYRDNGEEKPLRITVILYRYDKATADKWMKINYTTREYKELKEWRRDIIKTDTLHNADDNSVMINSYYKVTSN